MWRVTCLQCGASVVTDDGNSDRLACPCCPEAHSHEANANGCTGADGAHGGGALCGLGVAGCTVCRPCEISFTGTISAPPVVVR